MPWLIVSWFLAFGYVPEQTAKLSGTIECLDTGRIATIAQIGFDAELYNRFHLFTELSNYQYFDGDVFFDPYRIDYTIGGSFSLNKWISLTVQHECDHPVKAGTLTTMQSSETSIIARITGKSTF